jgi:hypothetical protein
LDRLQRPLFRRGEGRVDEGFTEIDFAAVAQILREPLQESVEAAGALPELKAAVDGLIRWIPVREIGPWCARAQDPQHGIHHAAGFRPRPPAAIGAPCWPEDRFQHGPLLVGQVHAVEYDGDPNRVHRPRMGFMR